ncbi:uncharacterized protein FSUBG_6863 [Fusarium subglutinans]|uniref:Uncharacterized protein n=1 Tax=Gibberella subglutinans TaxID=42677 RepID=A0A8H5PWR9_GIBSU|nr:uncharacterized protein FSUBG_6863 [Fusarium subglutinans]KAF5604560.1 hypothetical protein FSUBG_6863 [Fusarium subglutinans]
MSLQEDLEAYLQDYLDAPNVGKGEPAARFCHVEIPPYRLEIDVMEMFRQFFSKTDTQLFFVAPDMEIEQGLELGMDDTTTSYSYDQFLDIIQKNILSEQGVASTIWKKSVAGGWLEDCILPPDSVIVMQIDPNMPAGCVLSLAGIVEWAVDVSSDLVCSIDEILSLPKSFHNLDEKSKTFTLLSFTYRVGNLEHLFL